MGVGSTKGSICETDAEGAGGGGRQGMFLTNDSAMKLMVAPESMRKVAGQEEAVPSRIMRREDASDRLSAMEGGGSGGGGGTGGEAGQGGDDEGAVGVG